MFKNHEMKSVITNLAKDLEDHKEVEKELAKRSHFCQKVIQKYKQQIVDLKAEIEILREMGYDGTVSLELFNSEWWEKDPSETLKIGLERMKELFEK